MPRVVATIENYDAGTHTEVREGENGLMVFRRALHDYNQLNMVGGYLKPYEESILRYVLFGTPIPQADVSGPAPGGN